MVSALKARGIQVAGADRLMLIEQIAVQDLMALGDFICLPDDDLALASVLKSPLIGLDDDHLLALAPKRKGSLWQALLGARRGRCSISTRRPSSCARWRARAERMPPFEFYAGLLDSEGMRTRMLQRLGPEAAEPIDEFLNKALAFDAGAPPTLLGLPRLAARGQPGDQARHGAGPRRGARHDRARRQGPGGADRVPAGHLLDAVGAAAGRIAAARSRRRGRRACRRRSCGR